jgi:2-methylcitrate dehydratase PrpD
MPDARSFGKNDASWAIEELAFKKYASCGASHPAIEAAIDLADQHDLSLDDIESLELFGIWVGSGMVDVPWHDSENPHVLAQFCAPYEVVSAIKYRRFGPAEIEPEQIASDREVDAFARKVLIKHESEWGEGYPGGHTVRIKTRDGKVLVASRTPSELFDPGRWTPKEVIVKFRANASFSGLASEKQIEDMVEDVMHLEEPGTLADLMSTLGK